MYFKLREGKLEFELLLTYRFQELSMPQTEEGDILNLSLPPSLPLCLKQRRFVINRVILPNGVKGATYVVLTGHRSNTHETQGHGSHASNLPMCQHIDIVR